MQTVAQEALKLLFPGDEKDMPKEESLCAVTLRWLLTFSRLAHFFCLLFESQVRTKLDLWLSVLSKNKGTERK